MLRLLLRIQPRGRLRLGISRRCTSLRLSWQLHLAGCVRGRSLGLCQLLLLSLKILLVDESELLLLMLQRLPVYLLVR